VNSSTNMPPFVSITFCDAMFVTAVEAPQFLAANEILCSRRTLHPTSSAHIQAADPDAFLHAGPGGCPVTSRASARRRSRAGGRVKARPVPLSADCSCSQVEFCEMSDSFSGLLSSINASDGGVPKTPRPWAHVGMQGVDGDRQEDLRYHGGPDRAVCLYSLDLIEALQSEGHPISPGSIGENLTLSGIDWTHVRSDARVEIGDVLLEITRATSPCTKIAASFSGGEFVRVSQKVHPGWSRFYARVLREGIVTAGDRVVLRSPALLF
jgi:MOSC domain-containing protein YiiM